MTILEYCIIGAVVGAVVSIFISVFKGKKKAKPQKTSKPAEQPKAEEKPAEPDRSFKIAKKSRLSRVSKKALETNARTARVEKVFERTPPMPSTQQTDVYVSPLDAQSEQLLQSLEGVETSGRKVVSFQELKNQAKPITEEVVVDDTEEYSSAKYLSSGRAGEITGDYSGIHLGRVKTKPTPKRDNIKIEAEPIRDFNGEAVDFKALFNNRRLRDHNMFDTQDLPQHEAADKDEFDLNDAVVADAILHPRYQQKKIKHSRFKK